MKLHIYKFYQVDEIRFHACEKRALWMEDDWLYLGAVEVAASSKSDTEIALAALEKEEAGITAQYLEAKQRIEVRRQEFMALENN
jgi:hypothetical protein